MQESAMPALKLSFRKKLIFLLLLFQFLIMDSSESNTVKWADLVAYEPKIQA